VKQAKEQDLLVQRTHNLVPDAPTSPDTVCPQKALKKKLQHWNDTVKTQLNVLLHKTSKRKRKGTKRKRKGRKGSKAGALLPRESIDDAMLASADELGQRPPSNADYKRLQQLEHELRTATSGSELARIQRLRAGTAAENFDENTAVVPDDAENDAENKAFEADAATNGTGVGPVAGTPNQTRSPRSVEHRLEDA